MESKISQYDFHKEYEKDWDEFIAQFPTDDELKDDPITLKIKQLCCAIDELIHRLYKSDPHYGTQMDIFLEWCQLRGYFEDYKTDYTEKALNWFARQLMNMIVCNDPEIVTSVWYAIGVNYFECGNHGSFLFPIMYDQLSDKHIAKLVMASISIPWKDKVQTYRKIAKNKAHHKMLAHALQDSCGAYCNGSAKSSEALKILKRLDIDKQLRQEVSNTLSTPVEVEVVQIVALETTSKDGITGFISVVDKKFRTPTWFPYAELWIDNVYTGAFEEEYYRLSWSTIKSDYGISVPEDHAYREKILATKIPLLEDWKGKMGELRPT